MTRKFSPVELLRIRQALNRREFEQRKNQREQKAEIQNSSATWIGKDANDGRPVVRLSTGKEVKGVGIITNGALTPGQPCNYRNGWVSGMPFRKRKEEAVVKKKASGFLVGILFKKLVPSATAMRCYDSARNPPKPPRKPADTTGYPNNDYSRIWSRYKGALNGNGIQGTAVSTWLEKPSNPCLASWDIPAYPADEELPEISSAIPNGRYSFNFFYQTSPVFTTYQPVGVLYSSTYTRNYRFEGGMSPSIEGAVEYTFKIEVHARFTSSGTFAGVAQIATVMAVTAPGSYTEPPTTGWHDFGGSIGWRLIDLDNPHTAFPWDPAFFCFGDLSDWILRSDRGIIDCAPDLPGGILPELPQVGGETPPGQSWEYWFYDNETEPLLLDTFSTSDPQSFGQIIYTDDDAPIIILRAGDNYYDGVDRGSINAGYCRVIVYQIKNGAVDKREFTWEDGVAASGNNIKTFLASMGLGENLYLDFLSVGGWFINPLESAGLIINPTAQSMYAFLVEGSKSAVNGFWSQHLLNQSNGLAWVVDSDDAAPSNLVIPNSRLYNRDLYASSKITSLFTTPADVLAREVEFVYEAPRLLALTGREERITLGKIDVPGDCSVVCIVCKKTP